MLVSVYHLHRHFLVDGSELNFNSHVVCVKITDTDCVP